MPNANNNLDGGNYVPGSPFPDSPARSPSALPVLGRAWGIQAHCTQLSISSEVREKVGGHSLITWEAAQVESWLGVIK
jgi:hypothetical protein